MTRRILILFADVTIALTVFNGAIKLGLYLTQGM